MFTENNQNVLKIEDWIERNPDRGVRDIPEEPLSDGEVEYLKQVLLSPSVKAYVNRMLKSKLLTEGLENEHDAVSEGFIHMMNILYKFDKSECGDFTPFVIYRRTPIEKCLKEMFQAKRKAPKYVIKNIEEAIDKIYKEEDKKFRLLEYIQENRVIIKEAIMVLVKDTKTSFPKDEHEFIMSFFKELDKEPKDWNTKKYLKAVTGNKISLKESYNKINRAFKNRFRKANKLTAKHAVPVEKYDEREQEIHAFLVDFKKMVKDLSFDEWDIKSQKVIVRAQNQYVIPDDIKEAIKKVRKADKKTDAFFKEAEKYEKDVFQKLSNKITQKTLNRVYQSVILGNIDRSILTKKLKVKYKDKSIKNMDDKIIKYLNTQQEKKAKFNQNIEKFENKKKDITQELASHHLYNITELKKTVKERKAEIKSLTDATSFERKAAELKSYENKLVSEKEKLVKLIGDAPTKGMEAKSLNTELKGFEKKLEEYEAVVNRIEREKASVSKILDFFEKPELFHKSIDEIFELGGELTVEQNPLEQKSEVCFILDGEKIRHYDEPGKREAKSLQWYTLVYIQSRVNFVACEARAKIDQKGGKGPAVSMVEVPYNPRTDSRNSFADQKYEITGELFNALNKKSVEFQRYFYQKYILQVQDKELREEFGNDLFKQLKKERDKFLIYLSHKNNDWNGE